MNMLNGQVLILALVFPFYSGRTCVSILQDRVFCSDTTKIELELEGIFDSISPAILELTDLFAIDLTGNNLFGGIPSFLSELPLRRLELDDNPTIRGWFPNEILGIPSLVRLDLKNTGLVGSISNLTDSDVQALNLNYLNLAENNIVGEIPSVLFKLNPVYLHLQQNQFSGSIPVEIENLGNNIQLVDFSHNQLSGEIPTSFSELRLKFLYLSDNSFNGTLSEELFEGDIQSSLKEFEANDNHLDGDLPFSLGKTSNLRILDLSLNDLSGNFLDGLRDLSLLNTLNLAFNNFQGPIGFGTWSKMEYLDLGYSGFSGSLPEILNNQQLRSLKKLVLSGNFFNGTLPTSWGVLSSLEELYVDGNYLQGGIPRSFGDLTKLRIFHCQNNYLQGSIPESFLKLKNLKEVRVMSVAGRNDLCMDLAHAENIKDIDHDIQVCEYKTPRPTFAPTKTPTASPSESPSLEPTMEPSLAPTSNPTIIPTLFPTMNPTLTPSASPSTSTDVPTSVPTVEPTFAPSVNPSVSPTLYPSSSPTLFPTSTGELPSEDTGSPTHAPTMIDELPSTHGNLVGDDIMDFLPFMIYVGVFSFIFCILVIQLKFFEGRRVNPSAGAASNAEGELQKPRNVDLEGDYSGPSSKPELQPQQQISLARIMGGFITSMFVFGDFITDLMFALSLYYSPNERVSNLFYFAVLFITLPIAVNTTLVIIFSHKATKKKRIRKWIEKHDLVYTCIQCLAIFSVETIALASTGICGLDMPLTKYEIYRLRAYGVVNNVFEDIPQLVIVVLSNSDFYIEEGEDTWNIFAIITVCSSVASLIWTLLFRAQSFSMFYNDRERGTRRHSSSSTADASDSSYSEEDSIVNEKASAVSEEDSIANEKVSAVSEQNSRKQEEAEPDINAHEDSSAEEAKKAAKVIDLEHVISKQVKESMQQTCSETNSKDSTVQIS
eukprot:snap_masked-scaffold_1-processed-gene-21.42-mRNA-1 protein AED:0.28 eAED:0.29 QI:0/0/0/0.5/1/1/2/0/941